MQNSLAKKFFAVGSAVAMTLSLAAPFAAQAAAHAAGTNVSTSDGTVWFITPEGTRRAYTSAGAFLSYGFNSWSQVVAANADDLSLPAGSFIPPQDGTVFCATATKGSDVAGECSLVTAGMKAAFTSAAVFAGLGFSFANAEYGDSSFLNKTVDINSSTEAHKTGVLVNNNGTVQLVGATGLLGIPSLDVFNTWGYSFANVVPANAADKAMTQTGVMQARTPGQLNPVWTVGTQPPPPVGSVTVSLASDNPASGSIVASSSAVTLAKFNFSGSGTVSQIQLKRIGVSADSVLSNVYLYDGAMRLTDAASVGGSSLISFNTPGGIFTVSGSKTISVVAEIAGTATSGQTVGVQLTGFAVAGYSLGSASVSGNLHTVASVSDLATVDFGTVTPTGQTLDAAAGLEVFRSSVSIGTRDVTLSRLAVRQIGSVNYSDIKNLVLKVDGTTLGSVAGLDVNGYAMFSFSPTTLKSGTRIITILGDIVGGATRTFQFQIRNKVDVDFTDTNYNVVVSPVDTFPVGSGSANTIREGSLIIQKATDTPSGNVTDGATNVKLAKFTANAYGEPMKIETLTAAASSSDTSVTSLRNGKIMINGVQYGSTATLAQCLACTTTGGTSYTLNYTVQPGTAVTIEVYADMYDNDIGGNNLSNGDTVTAYLIVGSNNVQKMTSLGYVNVPSSAVSGNPITNVTGSVTFAKNQTYSNHAIPLPQTGYKIGAFTLVGSTSEDVTISSISVRDVSSTSLTSLYNIKVLVNGSIFGAQASSISVGGTSTFSSTLNLAQGMTVPVEVYADINLPTAGYAADTFGAQVSISGTAVNSSASIAASAAGQTLTIGSATLTAAQDPSTPVAAITAGNQTKTAAAFKWTSANDQFTISELVISVAAVTTVQNVIIKDGSNVIATQPGAASTTFSNLSISVPANATKILTVELQLGGVGTGAGTSGENVFVTLHSYKKAPASSGTVSTTTVGNISGNALYVYKAIPTITTVALPTSIPVAGTNTLAKFTLSSGGTGTIAWSKMIFAISTSTGVTLSSPTVWDADTNTQIAGNATFATTNVTFYTTNEQQITGAKTYVLKGTLGGTIGTDGNYISTSIAQPSSFVAPAIASAATVSSATFVWSDVSAQSHSFSTADWNNDYLVKNLPTDSQSLIQ